MVLCPHQPVIGPGGRARHTWTIRQPPGHPTRGRSAEEGQAPKGGSPSAARSSRLRVGEKSGLGPGCGRVAVVVGDPSLDEQPAATVTAADQAGGPGQEGQRLFGGNKTRGEQVLVEVEEGHELGRRKPMKGGLGPDHQAGTERGPVVVGGGELDRGHTHERRELVGSPGHPHAQGPKPGVVTDGTLHRPYNCSPSGTSFLSGGVPAPSVWMRLFKRSIEETRGISGSASGAGFGMLSGRAGNGAVGTFSGSKPIGGRWSTAPPGKARFPLRDPGSTRASGPLLTVSGRISPARGAR